MTKAQLEVFDFMKQKKICSLTELQSKFNLKTIKSLVKKNIFTLTQASRLREDDREYVYWMQVELNSEILEKDLSKINLLF